MKLLAYKFDLPLRHRFTISRGSIDVQETLIVELKDGEHSGYGEATTNDYYGATIESMTRSLNAAKPILEKDPLTSPEALWSRLEPVLHGDPFTLCAIDQAACDLWGKQQGRALYELWGLDPKRAPLTDFTIGIDTIETMVAKMREMPNWPIYKIKLGTDHDLEIIQRLRDETAAIFRVDANCAWTAEQTVDNAKAMKDLGVEFIEQPLPADCWQEMQLVYERSVLPIIADESCIIESDVKRCHKHFHGINIKLVKCGGLTPARRMITEARQLGMRVMIGCMTESTVGISAIAQLAPLLDYVDMDGALLLAEDIAEGVSIQQGRCVFPNRAGAGVRLTGNGQSIRL